MSLVSGSSNQSTTQQREENTHLLLLLFGLMSLLLLLLLLLLMLILGPRETINDIPKSRIDLPSQLIHHIPLPISTLSHMMLKRIRLRLWIRERFNRIRLQIRLQLDASPSNIHDHLLYLEQSWVDHGQRDDIAGDPAEMGGELRESRVESDHIVVRSYPYPATACGVSRLSAMPMVGSIACHLAVGRGGLVKWRGDRGEKRRKRASKQCSNTRVIGGAKEILPLIVAAAVALSVDTMWHMQMNAFDGTTGHDASLHA